MTPRLAPICHRLGDVGLLVELGDRIDVELHQSCLSLAEELGRLPAVKRTLTSYASVLVEYDPAAVRYDELTATVSGWTPRMTLDSRSGRTVEIPVIYDGPDLEEAAAMLRMPARELISRHTEPLYHVFLIGFSPGLPYLGPLPPELRLPRLASPRPVVPAGSVAIAGMQATIYTYPTPGGWRLLGRTPLALFDPDRDPPARLAVGDQVRFVDASQ